MNNENREYEFEVISADKTAREKEMLCNRPFSQTKRNFDTEAKYFYPGEKLVTAINTSIAVGEPLLITGEPGTGKTQTAFYVAYKLGIGPVIHFQVKSDSTAGDLLYHFDTVRYFYVANLAKIEGKNSKRELDKKDYIEHGPLWEAIEDDKGQKWEVPRVLLIDEIDKASRDFPNDLLYELDQMEFMVKQTKQTITAPSRIRPIVFITSNSERRLPEPFLRRCVYHHINFDDTIVEKAVGLRKKIDYDNLDNSYIDKAVGLFKKLRLLNLRKKPSTSELLVWLRILNLTQPELPNDIDDLPFPGVLLKDRQDLQEL